VKLFLYSLVNFIYLVIISTTHVYIIPYNRKLGIVLSIYLQNKMFDVANILHLNNVVEIKYKMINISGNIPCMVDNTVRKLTTVRKSDIFFLFLLKLTKK